MFVGTKRIAMISGQCFKIPVQKRRSHLREGLRYSIISEGFVRITETVGM
jgi:hypothetical protein